MRDLTVLLLPGLLCTGEVFASQVKALSERGQDIRIAEFRYERSIDAMADTAAGLLPSHRRVAVAGFSMGGMVAMALAERHPEAVDRLALVSSNMHPELPARRQDRLRYVEEARRTSLAATVERAFLENYLYRQDAAHRQWITRMAQAQGLEAFEAQANALATRPDSGPVLAGLTCPVLILGARNDPLCPPASQQAMFDCAQNATLEILDDCGHFSLLERPDAVTRALSRWLDAGSDS